MSLHPEPALVEYHRYTHKSTHAAPSDERPAWISLRATFYLSRPLFTPAPLHCALLCSTQPNSAELTLLSKPLDIPNQRFGSIQSLPHGPETPIGDPSLHRLNPSHSTYSKLPYSTALSCESILLLFSVNPFQQPETLRLPFSPNTAPKNYSHHHHHHTLSHTAAVKAGLTCIFNSTILNSPHLRNSYLLHFARAPPPPTRTARHNTACDSRFAFGRIILHCWIGNTAFAEALRTTSTTSSFLFYPYFIL